MIGRYVFAEAVDGSRVFRDEGESRPWGAECGRCSWSRRGATQPGVTQRLAEHALAEHRVQLRLGGKP